MNASWPARFEVRLKSARRATVYTVTTWKGAPKAVEIAAKHHAHLHPDEVVSDTETVELGGAPRADDGTALVEKSDLIDRMEW